MISSQEEWCRILDEAQSTRSYIIACHKALAFAALHNDLELYDMVSSLTNADSIAVLITHLKDKAKRHRYEARKIKRRKKADLYEVKYEVELHYEWANGLDELALEFGRLSWRGGLCSESASAMIATPLGESMRRFREMADVLEVSEHNGHGKGSRLFIRAL